MSDNATPTPADIAKLGDRISELFKDKDFVMHLLCKDMPFRDTDLGQRVRRDLERELFPDTTGEGA